MFYRLEKDGKKIRRMGTTAKIPVAPGLLKEEKLKFQRDIKTLQQQYDIPDKLILNYDHTPLWYVCAPNHTLHTRGEANIPLIGKGKKKQRTGTFTVTKSGDFLPMQIIYQGKTIHSELYFQKDLILLTRQITGVMRKNPLNFWKRLYFLI